MKLVTKEIERQLLKNGGNRGGDHKPAVKFFTPDANCTWLISQMDPWGARHPVRPVRPGDGVSGTGPRSSQ